MLRVVHLSTTDVSGGAALAAHRLHSALPDHSVTSTMFVASKRGQDAGVMEFKPAFFGPRALNQFLFRGARNVQRHFLSPPKGTFMTHDWAFFGGLVERQIPATEIVHLHWAMDLLDFRVLPRLAARVPLVWTFHDMNAFTGGCHYTRGCDRFTGECGACPLLRSADPDDATHRVILRKIAALRTVPESRLTIVSPSRWMASEVRRSKVFGRFPVEVIPNGIDVQTFRPLDRAELRRRHGFTPEDRIVLFVAEKLADPRKGMKELEEAIALVERLPNLKIVTMGEGSREKWQGPMYRHLGPLHDPAKICEAYNLADIVVIPTLQDNFPNTVIEALASGTPVVGFATGGVADAVEDEICGLLAPTGDIAGLAANMARALVDDSLRAEMSRAARARAVDCFSLERQAAACSALYRRLLNREFPSNERASAVADVSPIDHSLSA